MAQIKFGSAHTVRKLKCLEQYLRAYLKVFKNQSWAHTIYVDAFAGTGEIPLAAAYPELPLDDDGRDFIVGSARKALDLDESFDEYLFIEKQRNKARALERLRGDYPNKNTAILNADANDGLLAFCTQRNWKKSRAVVFLDPFGSQVEWRTIEAIAATKCIDLWYLFPAGLSVYRQISDDGTVHYTHEASLNRLFGTGAWRQAFIADDEATPDLFGHSNPAHAKVASPESVTQFMYQRLSGAFAGGVLNEWLPLGRHSAHWYSLMFAWANPSKGAKKAGEIARAVMRSGAHGRIK